MVLPLQHPHSEQINPDGGYGPVGEGRSFSTVPGLDDVEWLGITDG